MSDLVRFISLFVAFILIVGIIFAFTAGRNCLRNANEDNVAREVMDATPAFQFNAPTLMNEYLADEDAASAKLDGKVGIVSGSAILRGDLIYLHYSPDGNWINLSTNTSWAIRCFLTSDSPSRPAHYRLANYVLKGRIEGINAKRLSLDIRGCIILEQSWADEAT